MKPQSPCRNCEERKVGCHSECEKYISFSESLRKWNDIVAEERIREARADSVRVATAAKMKKYRDRGGRKP